MIRLRASTVSAVIALSILAEQASAADLTVGAFGRIWGKNLKKCAIEPFEKATGNAVEVVLGARSNG